MATPQPSTSIGELNTASSRLVWVLNRDAAPYAATFQGIKITIPANMEKIGKHVRSGGNLMEYMAACRFVRDLKQAQGYTMDSMGKPSATFGNKALCEIELNAEEFAIYVKKTAAEVKRDVVQEEKKARKTLTKELDKNPNKVVVSEDE